MPGETQVPLVVEQVRAWGVTAEEFARSWYWFANLMACSLDPVERTRAGAT